MNRSRSATKHALETAFGEQLAECVCAWPEMDGVGPGLEAAADLRRRIAADVAEFVEGRINEMVLGERITPPLVAEAKALGLKLLGHWPGYTEADVGPLLMSPDGRLALLSEMGAASGPLLSRFPNQPLAQSISVLIATAYGKIDVPTANKLCAEIEQTDLTPEQIMADAEAGLLAAGYRKVN